MREHTASDLRLAAEFGARIKEKRLEKGYTQEMLALLVGANRRAISEIERGKPTSYLGLALSIGEALDFRLMHENKKPAREAVRARAFKLPS